MPLQIVRRDLFQRDYRLLLKKMITSVLDVISRLWNLNSTFSAVVGEVFIRLPRQEKATSAYESLTEVLRRILQFLP